MEPPNMSPPESDRHGLVKKPVTTPQDDKNMGCSGRLDKVIEGMYQESVCSSNHNHNDISFGHSTPSFSKPDHQNKMTANRKNRDMSVDTEKDQGIPHKPYIGKESYLGLLVMIIGMVKTYIDFSKNYDESELEVSLDKGVMVTARSIPIKTNRRKQKAKQPTQKSMNLDGSELMVVDQVQQLQFFKKMIKKSLKFSKD